MSKTKQAYLGTAFAAALLCAAGGAAAQSYDDSYPADAYVNDRTETIIVRPPHAPYNQIERHQMVGHVNGEVDPVYLSITRPVSYSDLDLSNPADFQTLRERVYDTAHVLCMRLARRDPMGTLDSDPQATQQCIREASADAMSQVPVG